MTENQLEILLSDRAKALDFKKTAFANLKEILIKHAENNDLLCGFKQSEIKAVFDRFEYHVDKRNAAPSIITRIGIYVENSKWLDNLEPIGYYEFETNLIGEIVDDWFIIKKEKYLKDIDLISHFQNMNQNLSFEYLKSNHVHYEFVSYVSLVGTLFISKQFEGVALCIQRAYTYLEKTDNSVFAKDYLNKSKEFLKMMCSYLVTNNLVPISLKKELSEIKNL
ncbi:MAG: hypothetical protein RLZZ546_2256 [Bacteroidota bacterium]|jgi:hypothetical protein